MEIIRAGLPNITGDVWNVEGDATIVPQAGTKYSGALYIIDGNKMHNVHATESDIGNYPQCLNINASRSSEIYGAAHTVQPPALGLIGQTKI